MNTLRSKEEVDKAVLFFEKLLSPIGAKYYPSKYYANYFEDSKSKLYFKFPLIKRLFSKRFPVKMKTVYLGHVSFHCREEFNGKDFLKLEIMLEYVQDMKEYTLSIMENIWLDEYENRMSLIYGEGNPIPDPTTERINVFGTFEDLTDTKSIIDIIYQDPKLKAIFRDRNLEDLLFNKKDSHGIHCWSPSR